MHKSFAMVIVLLCLVPRANAAALSVSPSGFIVQDITPGRVYDVYKESGVRFTVNNRDGQEHAYVLSVHRPSTRGSWEKGYLEIPDPKWIWFDKDEITVPANGQGYANLILKIPEEEKYYNQRWVATIGIEGKPGPLGIGLAIDVRVQFETKSKADVRNPPDGSIAFVPSTIGFEHQATGRPQERSVIIYNNDDLAHTYEITPLFEDKNVRPVVYLTHAFKQLPNHRWLAPGMRQFRIAPKSSQNLTLQLTIPPDAPREDKKWEELLLVQPDQGPAGLIRIRTDVETKAN